MQARTNTAHQRTRHLGSGRDRDNVFVSDAWPVPATHHRPICEHGGPWSLFGLYIDTCRGCVFCVFSLVPLCWLALAKPDCAVPSLLLKLGNTTYPLTGIGSKGVSLPYMASEIVVATLFMVPRWRLCEYFGFFGCFVLAAD